MTNSTRIRIAGVATALFLAALSAAGLAARGTQGPDAPAAAAAVLPQSDEGSITPSDEPVVNTPYSADDEYESSEEDEDEISEEDEYESSEEDDD